MRTRLIESTSHDPWLNLALEERLFASAADDEVVLYLWRNASTVVIGRHQNPWVECRLDDMARDGVRLARRTSGGGAVFHDLGNTNFTFVMRREHYSVPRQIGVVTAAVAAMGAATEFSGRNDVVVDGRKVSGSAFLGRGDRWMHHGTLLLDADLGRLAHYLKPDPAKIRSKGVASVRARVANLAEFVDGADHEMASAALVAAFASEYGGAPQAQRVDPRELAAADPELREWTERHADDAWRFGRTPRFSHHLRHRFPWGGIDLHLDVAKGLVTDVEVFSDALDVTLIDDLVAALRGARYRRDDVADRIDERVGSDAAHGDQARDVAAWLRTALGSSAA